MNLITVPKKKKKRSKSESVSIWVLCFNAGFLCQNLKSSLKEKKFARNMTESEKAHYVS